MASKKRTVNIHGSIPALVTPFKGGKVDMDAFARIVEWQIASGSHGLVPCGTTGETPTLSTEEHLAVIKACVKVTRGRVPVIAGTGSNSTEKAVMLAKGAQKNGADAILVVTPYYNKPTQEGTLVYMNGGDDQQVTLSKVEKAGVIVMMPKTNIGENGYMAIFLDSEGNRMAVHSDR